MAAAKEALFSGLPQDCLVSIFHFLQAEDLQRVAGTCAACWEASEDAMLGTRLDLAHTRHADPEGLLCSLLATPSRRAQHVEAIVAPFAKHITGSFLRHLFVAPSVRLQELNLSRCGRLALAHLVSGLPAVAHSLTSLSLRHNDHLLHDAAIDQILHALSISPSAMQAAGGEVQVQAAAAWPLTYSELQTSGLRKRTKLRALDLGTNTRCAARASLPALTVTTLAMIGQACPGLTALSLTNQECVTDMGLDLLLNGTYPPPPLTSLDVGLCASLTDRGIYLLAHACPYLRVLSLRSVWRLTSPAIASLLVGCRDLESLNLNGCSTSNQHDPPLALHSLNLMCMQRLGDSDLLDIAGRADYRLREVSVSKCDGVTDEGIVQLCLACPSLELLNASDCIRVTAMFVHRLAEAHADRSLSDPMLSEPEDARPPLYSLTTLNVRHCAGWTDETTSLLLASNGCGAARLRTLYLGGCSGMLPGQSAAAYTGETGDPSGGGLTDASVCTIARVLQRNLGCLDLQGCRAVTDSGVLELTRRCPRLRRLTLSGLDLLSDATLQVVCTSLPCLTELSLNACQGLSEQEVYGLRRKRPDISKLTHRRVMHLQGAKAY